MRRASLIGLATLVLVVAAGCGGSSSGTKPQFDAEFKAVCDAYAARADRELGEVEGGDPTSAHASPLEVQRFGRLLGQVATLFGEQLRDLRQIDPPASEASKYHEFLRLYGQIESSLQRAVRSARKGDRAGLARQLDGLDTIGQRIGALGFQCG